MADVVRFTGNTFVHGSGSVGTLNTPVELAATTRSFGSEQAASCEAGRKV
jgi:hypothetical protein